ncbi:TetR/AcrR family transcriptional regulator [Nocardia panacis]|nr:TetR/AcrR family transcriptional regulator [Nocardia panacis]
MAGKDSWLTSGPEILGASGPGGLTIDKLVAATGLSTGSFYHHFAGMSGYRTALLDHFAEVHTTRYLREIAAADLSARQRLESLIDRVLDDDSPARIEPAIRAWAVDDPQAATVQERIDTARLDILRNLLEANGYAPEDARQTGLVVYLLVLGAASVLPTVAPAELRVPAGRILR